MEAAYVLLDGAAGTTNGGWTDCAEYNEGIILVEITGTATVQLQAINEPSGVPTPPTAGTLFGAPITVSGHVIVSVLPLFLKATVTSFTSGTINVRAVYRTK
jgi:hypothetical protein